MGRPREHNQDTKSALLNAAGRLLSEYGPEALSLRRVADQAGTTTQAIYTLFGGKDGLLHAMYRQGFETLDHHLAAVAPGDDAVSELCELGLAYRASALSQPWLYAMMFSRSVPEFMPAPEDEALALGTLDRLRASIQRYADHFGNNDEEAMTLQIWALAHGLASLELHGALGEPEQAKGHWRQAFCAIIHGYMA